MRTIEAKERAAPASGRSARVAAARMAAAAWMVAALSMTASPEQWRQEQATRRTRQSTSRRALLSTAHGCHVQPVQGGNRGGVALVHLLGLRSALFVGCQRAIQNLEELVFGIRHRR